MLVLKDLAGGLMSHTIEGRWRGHYTYHSVPDSGSGFDAEFVADKNTISGDIIDHEQLGPAVCAGAFSYPHVQFTKQYVQSGRGMHPIEYVGTMSDDGKTMRGKWTIYDSTMQVHGSWTAHRTDLTTHRDNENVHSDKLEEVL
ncbi:MAG TPA: hypothetical protein V6C76_00355 [Drouetiella sp.]